MNLNNEYFLSLIRSISDQKERKLSSDEYILQGYTWITERMMSNSVFQVIKLPRLVVNIRLLLDYCKIANSE